MAQLTLSAAIEATTVNLTSVGGVDWAVWNTTPANLTPSEFKSGGGSTISAALYGGGSVSRSGTVPRTMSWTDGTNVGTDSNTAITYNSGFTVGQGFEVTFPASTTTRVAKLYVGYFAANVRVTAIISDTSTANQVDSSTLVGADATDANGTVTVTYAAASGSQTMTIRVEVLTSLGGSRNCGIQAAAYALSAGGDVLMSQICL